MKYKIQLLFERREFTQLHDLQANTHNWYSLVYNEQIFFYSINDVAILLSMTPIMQVTDQSDHLDM
jgi:hypothetical protein